MSLLTLRNNYINPKITEATIFHGHLLQRALDGDDDLAEEVVRSQGYIDKLLILKESVGQSYHTANDSETIKRYYEQANDLGLKAHYGERDVIEQAEVKTTELQKLRKQVKVNVKALAKPVVDVKTDSKVIIVEGNLLEVVLSGNDYILHQTNATSTQAKGIALDIFQKFPQADIYKSYKSSARKALMGGIIVTKPVIGIMGQLSAGAPKAGDDKTMRLDWFRSALDTLASRINANTLAVDRLYFPYGIGCGLARGNWNDYSGAIASFADKIPNTVYIVKFAENKAPAKPESEPEVAPEPAKVLTKPAPKPAPVTVETELKPAAPPTKLKAKVVKPTNYVLRTDKYGQIGKEIALKYGIAKFNLATQGATDEDVDTVMWALASSEGDPIDQISSVAAITPLIGKEPTKAVVTLHNNLKNYVLRA